MFHSVISLALPCACPLEVRSYKLVKYSSDGPAVVGLRPQVVVWIAAERNRMPCFKEKRLH